MRTLATSLLVLSLAISTTGCMMDLLASTAIQGELQREQLGAIKGQIEGAQRTKSDIELNSAIQAFAAENGRYPSTLQELVPEYFTTIPTKPDGTAYGYDSTTGKLLETSAPTATAAIAPRPSGESDEQKMVKLSNAIYQFGQNTGYYPGSLQQLVPNYLPSLPKASNGQDFVYDPNSGMVWSPAPSQPSHATSIGGVPAPAPRQPAVGGGGLMGETLTGIGISNQLDNMSSAGSSAAGSRMRGDARNAGQGHDQQQQQVMNDLGL